MIKFPKSVLTEIESFLNSEKQKVQSQIHDLTAQDPYSDTSRLADNAASDTEAKEETDHERFEAMLIELKHKLELIESALRRIDKGTYGPCENCGNLIDTSRLAAMPTAVYCINCEQKKISK